MKLIKRIVSIILISVLLVINITPASAFNRNEHDRLMCYTERAVDKRPKIW